MKRSDIIPTKIYSQPDLLRKLFQWRFLGKSIAFTNGCFDILHEGHIYSLSAAAKEADILIVGVNADDSVKKLKGPDRPINNQQSRALLVASLLMVDAVVIFEEETPLKLIQQIMPDVLIKGGDYLEKDIAGASEVIAAGGQVIITPTLKGFSTSGIIKKLKQN